MQEKQRTVPVPDLKEHFMISSTQHLNIYSSLKILSTTNAQRVYSMCGKVRWWVVAGDNHVQVSPAYLCIHTRPVHKQYTPFHPALQHCPSRATYLQTHPTVQGNNSLPVSLSPPHTSCGEGRLHWTPTKIRLHRWPTDTTALVGMYLCS